MGYQGALIDLDGVIYNDSQVIPGAVDSIRWLEDQEIPFRFITNTTMRSRETLCKKLAGFGIEISYNRIFSAAYAASLYVKKSPHAKCFLLLLEDAQIDFKEIKADDEEVKYVVVGDMGDKFNYDLLNKAFLHLHRGARLVAVQKNRFWLSDAGDRMDAGPFVALLEYAANIKAILIGKPAALFFEMALSDLGLAASQVVMIGDDLESDIAGAHSIGAGTCLVKTGKFRQADLQKSALKPDHLLYSITELRSSNFFI